MLLIGNYRHCYMAESAHVDTKKKAAQAGVTTELLRTALQNGPVVAMTKDGLVKTRQELNWNDSFYNFNATYGEYMEAIGDDVGATIVCLPCKAKLLKQAVPTLTVIGLFCSHIITDQGLRLLTEGQPAFRYSHRGDKGMLIGGNQFIPMRYYWSRFFNYCYIPAKCMRCRDLTAEYADISIGDDHDKGLNIIVTRTKEGQRLFNQTVQDLHIIRTNARKVYKSQYHYTNIKKGIFHPITQGYILVRGITNYLSRHTAFQPLFAYWASKLPRVSINHAGCGDGGLW